jgi:hypothetical protein
MAPPLVGLQINNQCQTILDIMPGPLRKVSWWSTDRSLSQLLGKFRSSKSSDPRDLVYALLGISSDHPESSGLVADYRKKEKDVALATWTFISSDSHWPTQFFEASLGSMRAYVDDLHCLLMEWLRLAISMQDIRTAKAMLAAGAQNSEDVMAAAASTTSLGFMNCLFEHFGYDLHSVTHATVIAMLRNTSCGCQLIDTLFINGQLPIDVTEQVVLWACANTAIRKKYMGTLLRQFTGKTRSREVVVAAASIRSPFAADAVLELLERSGLPLVFTDEMLTAASQNSVARLALLSLHNEFLRTADGADYRSKRANEANAQERGRSNTSYRCRSHQDDQQWDRRNRDEHKRCNKRKWGHASTSYGSHSHWEAQHWDRRGNEAHCDGRRQQAQRPRYNAY